MSESLRCYVLRADDGGLFCGAHPFESREEATRARDGMFGDGLGVPEVIELVEVVRCGECRQWVNEPTEAGYGHCVTEGYIKADWYCPNGSRR